MPLYAKVKSVCALKRSITTQICLLLSTRAIHAPRYYARLPQHAVNPYNNPSTTRRKMQYPLHDQAQKRKMQYPLHDQAQNYLARCTLVPDSVSDQSLTTSSRQPRARIRNTCNMVVNTQHEPGSAAVSFTPMTNRDKGSQSPPIRPFPTYKFVTDMTSVQRQQQQHQLQQ